MAAEHITDAAFPAYLGQELRFLRTAVKKEPWERASRVHYAEALQSYWKQESVTPRPSSSVFFY